MVICFFFTRDAKDHSLSRTLSFMIAERSAVYNSTGSYKNAKYTRMSEDRGLRTVEFSIFIFFVLISVSIKTRKTGFNFNILSLFFFSFYSMDRNNNYLGMNNLFL